MLGTLLKQKIIVYSSWHQADAEDAGKLVSSEENVIQEDYENVVASCSSENEQQRETIFKIGNKGPFYSLYYVSARTCKSM